MDTLGIENNFTQLINVSGCGPRIFISQQICPSHVIFSRDAVKSIVSTRFLYTLFVAVDETKRVSLSVFPLKNCCGVQRVLNHLISYVCI